MALRFLWLILTVFLLSSCSTSQFGWDQDAVESTSEAHKGKYVEDFDPLSLDDDDIVVPPPEEKKETVQTVEPVENTPEVESTEKETTQGFRVQLLATGDEMQAREEQRDAIFKFPQVDVYLALEGSLYKLRIGDCRTRKEAEELRDQAARRGFRDAWIVPSVVVLKKGGETDF